MKTTGIVRKIDDLGRVTLPKELRDALGMEHGTPLEIYTTESGIMLKKYERGCIFCGEMKSMVEYKGRLVCVECQKKLAAAE